jgi:galactokinase
MSLADHVAQEFQRRYGETPTCIVRAPGRVNLIGEHTDYNDGFVLPMAIDRAFYLALRPRNDNYVIAHSLDFDSVSQFSIEELDHQNERDELWGEYLKGVAWSLGEAGYLLQGWEGVGSGDVPIGAGLSSSAAIELATARAFAAVSDLPWHPATMAKICQRAENDWIGVKTGIMDQMISASGVANHAVLIDCRSLETRSVPIPADTVVVIMDTSTRRELVTSAYNERREQCETAARFYGVRALRDLSMPVFDGQSWALDDVVRRRARHVISENERTTQAADAMEAGDAVLLGRLMNASHDSLRDDFEVTNDALNAIVQIARPLNGCYGARMTGGGFGGCAVALVDEDAAAAFAETVSAAYHTQTNLTATIYITHATDGAAIIS